MAEWTFLTHHAQVLLSVARESDNRLSRIAESVGITERATHRIVTDLIVAGYLTRHRLGRRSFYEINADLPLRDAAAHQLGEVFRPLLREASLPSDPAASLG